jgi:hypothetical protein
MDYLISYPSIVAWNPFNVNESWGQFKTSEMVTWTKNHAPSRLVNSTSASPMVRVNSPGVSLLVNLFNGGNHYHMGDMIDLHNYPGSDVYLFDTKRANIFGEYGGIGLLLRDHLWQTDKNWGYTQYKSSKEATDEYIRYAEAVKGFIKRGFSAAVYIQTTDVEGEVNGLMTYDRKVVKLEKSRLRQINLEICNSLK